MFMMNLHISICLGLLDVCVKIELANNLKDFMSIKVDDTIIKQHVLYVNLLNTCYRCQSSIHKIEDCPLMVEKFKAKGATPIGPTPRLNNKRGKNNGNKGTQPNQPFTSYG